jgi:hypothetical protein
MGVPKFPKLGLLQLWGLITLCEDLWLKWGIEQSFSLHRKLYNGMSHTTCVQGNWGDFWLLVVGSQIGNLTSGLSFSHNLCLKCPNESWKPILNIYVLRAFQWYKELFNPMSFDLWNLSLKIRESISTPTAKVRVHLGVWGFIPSHFFALPGAWNATLKLPSWPAPLQALALVANPRLRLRHPWYH